MTGVGTDGLSRTHLTTIPPFISGLALVLLLGCAMVAADPWFSFLDDETGVVDAAAVPAREIVRDYLSGEGYPGHPPLSHLLLHFWLRVGGGSPRLIRLPSIVFFLAGLLILATLASRLAGPPAYYALLWVGVLWPYGFHFGRLAGYYGLSFFLVALLTAAYFRCLDRPDPRSWLYFGLAAWALVYTIYFGWAILGCLVLDFLRRRRRERLSLRPLLMTLLALIVVYVPIWHAFERVFPEDVDLHGPLVSKVLLGGYNLYCLFISESIAPWHWALGLPAGAAILLSLVLAVLLLPKDLRYFLGYFALLFSTMALLGLVTTKRSILISGWLLLPLACALANHQRKRLHRALALSLGLIAALGWFGIFSRAYYGAQHFVEPWQGVAQDAARAINHGATVVSNSPSFFFYLNYALEEQGAWPRSGSRHFVPGFAQHPRVFEVEAWNAADHPATSEVVFVRGVTPGIDEEAPKAQAWLNANCSLGERTQLLPNSGYELKKRFLPGWGQLPFRITIERYDCSLRANREVERWGVPKDLDGFSAF